MQQSNYFISLAQNLKKWLTSLLHEESHSAIVVSVAVAYCLHKFGYKSEQVDYKDVIKILQMVRIHPNVEAQTCPDYETLSASIPRNKK